jgi:hypothetical protein
VKLINKIYFNIVMITVWSWLNCAFATTPVAEKFNLEFKTKYQVGRRYHCNFTAELFKLTRVRRSTDSSTRHRSLKVKLIGDMTIIALDARQMIAECEFAVDKFSGWSDQRAIKSDLKGKVLTVLFKQKSAQLLVKGDKYQPLSKQERLLLSLIFPSILEEDLADILGANRQVAIGAEWQPPSSKFLALFNQHGIKFSSSKVKLRAELSGREVFQDRDCFVIEERIKTLNIPSFKFNFTLKVWLPTTIKSGNALKIQRQAVWNASATLPSNTPLVIGHTVSTTVVNSLDFTMIPQ